MTQIYTVALTNGRFLHMEGLLVGDGNRIIIEDPNTGYPVFFAPLTNVLYAYNDAHEYVSAEPKAESIEYDDGGTGVTFTSKELFCLFEAAADKLSDTADEGLFDKIQLAKQQLKGEYN